MKLGTAKNFRDAFVKETALDRIDWIKQRIHKREEEGLDADEPRAMQVLAKHPLISRTGDALGTSTPGGRKMRDRMGMGLADTVLGRGGQMLGTATSDVLQDNTRSIWWLMNALQAVSNVGAEMAFKVAAPDLYATQAVKNRYGNAINLASGKGRADAVDVGAATFDDDHKDQITLNAGYSSNKNRELRRRAHAGGHAAALLFPQGFAINSALGLMTPFGGAPGYEAALPDPEDKSKTSNVLGEMAAKYFMGRTGNLLPYEEFSKVRPDVSRGEYNAYKAFKYDKKGDLDLSDGDFTLPTGVLKGTVDGIHGPELQFLGRSLPLTTGIVPYAGSVLGGVAAAYLPRNRKYMGNQLVNMLIGTTAGTAAGMVGGNLLEAERQRRNKLANNPVNVDVGF